MLKINPAKVTAAQTLKKTADKAKTFCVNLSTEENGFFYINGKRIKMIFPR